MARSLTATSRLVACQVSASDPENIQWSKRHRLDPRPRWRVKRVDGLGSPSIVVHQQKEFYASYAKAVAAIEEIESVKKRNQD